MSDMPNWLTVSQHLFTEGLFKPRNSSNEPLAPIQLLAKKFANEEKRPFPVQKPDRRLIPTNDYQIWQSQ
jgi:hypothetical protein